MKYTYKRTKHTTDVTEYEVTVDFSEFKKFQDLAFEKLAREVKIKGFRPGKAPKAKIEEKIGSDVLNEAIQQLLPEPAIEIIEKDNMRPVTRLDYSLDKLTEEDGVVYTFSFTNFPDVVLGDFSKLKVKKDEVETTQEDLDMVIKSIVRSSVKPEVLRKFEKNPAASKGKDTEEVKEGEEAKEQVVEDFELSDELIKELGYEKEKTLDEVRVSVKEKLEEMKQQQIDEKYVNDIVAEAVKVSKFEIPKSFLEKEVENFEADFNARLKDLQLDAETYLQTQGATLEEKRKEWEKQAKEKIQNDILLINVALKHDIMPGKADVEAELKAMEDPNMRADYDSDNGRELIRTVLTRRRGLNKLMELVEGKK